MSFTFTPIKTNTNTASDNPDRPKVDYNEVNTHVIERAGTATKKRSIPGYISGIVDLGIQPRVIETEVKDGETYPEDAVYFKGQYGELKGKDAVRFVAPSKQAVALLIDFPQVLVNKGKFFREDGGEELPLRLVLNGEGMVKTPEGKWQSVVQYPIYLSETKHDDGVWAVAKNAKLHKLAEAAGILDAQGYFKVNRLGELLGKCLQFEFQCFMKPSKKDHTKLYYTEIVKLVGIVPEGVPVPPMPEGIVAGIEWSSGNTPDATAVQNLRLSIKNTIRNATNYEGSTIQPLIEAPREDRPPPVVDKPKAKVDNTNTKKATAGSGWEDDSLDDEPF
jgi:hypothetical protein